MLKIYKKNAPANVFSPYIIENSRQSIDVKIDVNRENDIISYKLYDGEDIKLSFSLDFNFV